MRGVRHVFLALVITACTDPMAPASPDAGTVDAAPAVADVAAVSAAERAAAAEAWLDFHCRGRVACPWLSWVDFATVEGCKAFFSNPGTVTTVFDQIRSGVVRVTAAGVACMTQPIACNGYFPVCDGGLAGTLPIGAACLSDYACADGECVSNLYACGSVCQPPASCGGKTCAADAYCGLDAACHPRVGVGEACAFADCAAPGVCDRADFKCKLPGAAGEPCSDFLPCQAGLRCTTWGSFEAIGFCAPVVGAGGACDKALCQLGLWCTDVAGSAQCAKAPAIGEPCLGAGSCRGIDVWCASATGSGPGVCKRLPRLGEPCGTAGVAKDCELPGVCHPDVDVCVEALGVGHPCVAGTCALGLDCIGTCRAPGVAGEPCVSGACALGHTCRDGKCEAVVCAPKTVADCQGHRECLDQGRCTPAGGGCVATSDADCLASKGCKDHGKCVALAGRCRASAAGCAASKSCVDQGQCTVVASECRAGGDADCAGSKECPLHGRCVAVPTAQGLACGATAASCKAWVGCKGAKGCGVSCFTATLCSCGKV